MGNSGDRCDNKWISLTNRSDPPWKSLSTVISIYNEAIGLTFELGCIY